MSTEAETKKPKSLGKRLWNTFAYVLFLVVFILVVGEVAVRLMGASPWNQETHSFKVEPGGSFFQADELLGYTGRPGKFKLTLSDSLHIELTHNDAGYRITSPPGSISDTLPEVWIMGCSFTHGYGVIDSVTYPWRLQSQYPNYKIRNFGMDGYGTYHAQLQIESLLAEGRRPALVILAYGGFHDQRNINNRYWRKALSGREVAEGITYPFVRFNEQGDLVPGLEKPEYHPWFMMRYSALVHYIEKAFNRSEDEELRPFEVSKKILLQLKSRLSQEKINFLVVNIFQHSDSDRMLQTIGNEIQTCDISVNLDDLDLRILPQDGHPNAEGHRRMADKLIDCLQIKALLENPAVSSPE